MLWTLRMASVAAGCLLMVVGWGLTVRGDDSPQDLARKQDREKQVQADTDHLVRRARTMLRVLDYYQLEKGAERRLLSEVAGVLRGLSRQQMNEVIARLEKAATIPDSAKVSAETEQAYVRHREILVRLRELLSRFEAIRSLQQAAERMEQASRQELELSLRASGLVHQWQDAPENGHPRQGQKTRAKLQAEMRVESDEQADLGGEASGVLKQIEELRSRLPHEQQEQVREAQELAHKEQVLETMSRAANGLTPAQPTFERMHGAVALQRKSTPICTNWPGIPRPARSAGGSA